MWTKVLLIAAAGALGTLARWGLDHLVQRLHGGPFPWGTFAANVLGCFLFGLIWAWSDAPVGPSAETRMIILTGFMGAFTTFSTFIFYTHGYLAEAKWFHAAGHFAAHNVAGIAALFLGIALAKAG